MSLKELGLDPWQARAFAFVWGLLWGSFLNVVIYRVPRAMSVAHPGSHCPSCGTKIQAWNNVPVLSWVLLRGRARCCGARISGRYVLVELLGGLLGIATWELAMQTSRGGEGAAHLAAVFLANFALALALVAAAFIDAEHMILPDAITLGGTLFGLMTPGLREMTYADAALGAAAGFFVVWAPLIVGYRVIRGRTGMGLGDAKLVMLAGAFFGWQGALFALFAGSLQATLGALLMWLVLGKIEEPESVKADRQALRQAADEGDVEARDALADDPLGTEPGEGFMAARLPFGPFLCLAIIEWMLAASFLTELWSYWVFSRSY